MNFYEWWFNKTSAAPSEPVTPKMAWDAALENAGEEAKTHWTFMALEYKEIVDLQKEIVDRQTAAIDEYVRLTRDLKAALTDHRLKLFPGTNQKAVVDRDFKEPKILYRECKPAAKDALNN